MTNMKKYETKTGYGSTIDNQSIWVIFGIFGRVLIILYAHACIISKCLYVGMRVYVGMFLYLYMRAYF